MAEKSAEDLEVSDDTEKFQNTSVTLADLRRNDEAWMPLPAAMKSSLERLFQDQISFFRDAPLIRYGHVNIAQYVRDFLSKPDSETGWSLDVDPSLFCELAYEGFLCTGLELDVGTGDPVQVLMPWIAPIRNSLDFRDVHISRQVRKRAKHYSMTVNTAYDEVMLGCIHQHGECWLYRGLRWLLRRLFKDGYKGLRNTGSGSLNVGVHSVELWTTDGELVAGDLGYTVGGVYTSMTGFRRQLSKHAGEVQMVLTAALLERMGYDWWDLGMVMKYKRLLGARIINRDAFVERLHKDRDKAIKFQHERIGGAELLSRLRALQANDDPAGVNGFHPDS